MIKMGYLPVLAFFYGIFVTMVWVILFTRIDDNQCLPMRIRDWVGIVCVGWFVSPFLIFVWLIDAIFSWIKKHW